MIVIGLLPAGSCLVCDAVIYKQSYFEENLLIVVAFYILKLTTLPAMQVVENALAYRKKTSNDTIYVGSPTAYKSKEVSKWM